MSADISLFDFQGRQVRTATVGGQVWFVAADVCAILGLTNVSMALSRLDGADISSAEVWSAANNRHYALKSVNEFGLYDLILDSRKPEARAFRRWVTSVVLPTIRASGGVFIDPGSQLAHAVATDPAAALAMASTVIGIAKGLQERNRALEAKNTELAAEHTVLAPKAAAYDAFFDSNDTCSVRDAARMLRNLYDIGEGELRRRMRRKWRWVEVHSTAATAYATGRGYMVNVTHVNEFGPCPTSGRLTAKGFQRAIAKLRAELPKDSHGQPPPH